MQEVTSTDQPNEEVTPPGAAPNAPGVTTASNRYSRAVLWLLRRLGADPDKYEPDGSRWPTSRQQFLWDLAPDELAPRRDGLNPPPQPYFTPAWAHDLSSDEDIDRMYEMARTFRRDADESTKSLELKASRLATVLVALLTANVALIIFEITRLGSDPSTGRILLVGVAVSLGIAALTWLVFGLTRAVDADQRMGITGYADLGHVASNRRDAMLAEADGFRMSNWTRLMKANRLLDARAAVSRSMVFLIASAILALVLSAVVAVEDEGSQEPEEHSRPGVRHYPPRHDWWDAPRAPAERLDRGGRPAPPRHLSPTPQPTRPTISSTPNQSTPTGAGRR
jgi:hypothetical protein